MFQYSTIGAAPAQHAPAHMGFQPPSAQVGQMVPFRYYDIVGAETGEKGMWDKLKEWGDKEMITGVKNKYLVLTAAIVGVAWYGYYARWWR